MRIDFLINQMSGGGAERVVSILANYMAEKGFQVRLITFTGTDKYPLDPRVERIRLHFHPFFHSVVFNGFFSLLRFYRKKKNRPDIMNSHIDLLGYLTIPVSLIYRIPIINSEHNNHLSQYTWAERFLWNVFYRFPRAITILTEFDREYFSKRSKKVVHMPNPSPFEPNLNPNLEKIRRKEIVAVGNLNRYHHKGFDNLIEIAARLLPHHPDWKINLVGGGEEGAAWLKKKINEKGLQSQFIFSGWQNNMREMLDEIEIFVLSSRYEGLPMVLIEAMSLGVPCVAYDCISGPSDVIQNEVTGLLVENQNIDAMVSALDRLMREEALRSEFRRKAPLSMQKFSISVIGKKWEQLIEETLEKK